MPYRLQSTAHCSSQSASKLTWEAGIPTLQRKKKKTAQRGEEVRMEKVPDTYLWQLDLLLTCGLLSTLQSSLNIHGSKYSLQSRAFLPGWTPAPEKPLPRKSAFTSQSLSLGVGQKFPHFDPVSPQKVLICIKSSDMKHRLFNGPPFLMVTCPTLSPK